MLFELPSCLLNVFLEVSTTLGRGKFSKRSGGRVDPKDLLLAVLGVLIFHFPRELKGINFNLRSGDSKGYVGLRVAT